MWVSGASHFRLTLAALLLWLGRVGGAGLLPTYVAPITVGVCASTSRTHLATWTTDKRGLAGRCRAIAAEGGTQYKHESNSWGKSQERKLLTILGADLAGGCRLCLDFRLRGSRYRSSNEPEEALTGSCCCDNRPWLEMKTRWISGNKEECISRNSASAGSVLQCIRP